MSDYKDLIEQAIADKLQAEGSTTAQIEDALTVLTPLCSHKNGMTLLQMPGEAAVSIDTPQAVDTLRRRKPHLFPRVMSPALRSKLSASGRILRSAASWSNRSASSKPRRSPRATGFPAWAIPSPAKSNGHLEMPNTTYARCNF